ncbi:nucleotidyltransferase domain-containing protein [Leptolyngbya sp. PCC 6406]|uniref:nucleotidyltransferase domain-containing protein n=1 Tax=Leptolyngbya sp. PCC 6406 TaxID=1173264 RepID=UPI0002AC5481|nr:nucleotidyltransferase domain-containing protein [Leptolyngbya sp. PCC 6406]
MRRIADIPLKLNDRLAIKAATDLLLDTFPVEQVMLYGSKASGQDTPESDIDLLVLTAYPLPWQERNAITDALFDLELTYDVVLSTLVVAHNDWMNSQYSILPIHREIDQHGVVLV